MCDDKLTPENIVCLSKYTTNYLLKSLKFSDLKPNLRKKKLDLLLSNSAIQSNFY